MIVYADASALVKRYIAEVDSDRARGWIADAEHVACCRFGYVEVYRAIVLTDPPDVTSQMQAFERDWEKIVVLEVDEILVRRAAVLASGLKLRSLDALHLAGAEQLNGPDFRLLTWDRRLWHAAHALGLPTLPEQEP